MSITREHVYELLRSQVRLFIEECEDQEGVEYWERFPDGDDKGVISDFLLYTYCAQLNPSKHIEAVVKLVRNWVRRSVKGEATFESSKAAINAFLKCISWSEGREFLDDATHDAWHEGIDVGLSSTVREILRDDTVFNLYLSMWMRCKDEKLLEATAVLNEGWMGRSLQTEARIEVENFAHMSLKRTLLIVELNGVGKNSIPEREIELAKDLGLIDRETCEVLCLISG